MADPRPPRLLTQFLFSTRSCSEVGGVIFGMGSPLINCIYLKPDEYYSASLAVGIYLTPPHWIFTPLLRSPAPQMARNFRNSDGAVGAIQKKNIRMVDIQGRL